MLLHASTFVSCVFVLVNGPASVIPKYSGMFFQACQWKSQLEPLSV